MISHGLAQRLKRVPLLNKIMNAKTAGHVGTPQSKIFLTGHINMIYGKTEFPRGISDQTISQANSTRGLSDVRSGPGLKPQASSFKLQASEKKNGKPQAPSSKLQASSRKLQAQ